MRQLCNVAYSIQTENMKDEERERFDADIGQIEDPELAAVEELKRYQAQEGIVFDNPDAPVQGQADTWKDEEFR